MTTPDLEDRYRRAVQALEVAQRAEKAALREFHDARHALITARALEFERYGARLAAVATDGPCPRCGKLSRPIGDGVERRHLDPVAGMKCGKARVAAVREGLGSALPRLSPLPRTSDGTGDV